MEVPGRRSIHYRLLRFVFLAATVLIAGSCGDRSVFGPHSISPRRASLSVLPSFPQIPAGGPTIRLARVVGVLTAATGEGSTSEARFDGDSAVLAFDVQITGNSAEFTLELTAYDAQGAVVFHSIQKITLKPGTNDNVPAPALVYAAADAALSVLHVAPGSAQIAAGGSASFGVSGTNASGQPVSPIRVGWSSRDPSIATVDANGNVVAGTSQGSTWIVARTATNLADSASVKVRAPVAKVTVSPGSATLARGQSSSFTAELRDAGNHLIDDRTATWSSSDPSVASISASGGVVAAKIGTATITASAEGKTASAAVTVVSPVDHIELAPTSLTFASIGQSGSLTPKVVARAGASIDGITVSFSTSNGAVATVDSKGGVVATGNGSTTITASADGSTATAGVTVKQVVASVAVSPKAASVAAIGESRTFTATVLDAAGSAIQSPVIAWTSSDAAIAAVTGGVAVAKRAGSVTITASIDGKSDAATFIVAPTARLLVVLSNRAEIKVGESATISAAFADGNGNVIGPAVAAFTVSPSSVAQFAGTSLVGRLPGTAHITATSGNLTGSLDIRVTAPTNGLDVFPATMERLPSGYGFFSLNNATSSVTWTVNGIPGGNFTFGTIDVEGFYEAPEVVPTPSTFDVCAVQASPPLQGCSRVTIRAVPTAGADLVVINDLNAMQDGGIGRDANTTFFKNLVGFTPVGARAAATKVLFQYGHASQCGADLCSPSQTTELRTAMASAGITAAVDDNSASVGVIPSDVKVVFLMTPTTHYSVLEVNNLKSFADGGGRIVFIGENTSYYTGIQPEQALLPQLGSEMSITNGLVNCSNFDIDASHILPHPTTVGVTTLYVPCASGMTLGPNDYAIALGQVSVSTSFFPVIASVKVDTRQVSFSESRGAASRTTLRRPPTVILPTPAVRDTTGYGPRGKPNR